MFSGDKDDEVVQEPVQEKLDRNGKVYGSSSFRSFTANSWAGRSDTKFCCWGAWYWHTKIAANGKQKTIAENEVIIPNLKLLISLWHLLNQKLLVMVQLRCTFCARCNRWKRRLAKAPDFASQEPSASGKEQASMMLLNSGGAAESSNNTFVLEPLHFLQFQQRFILLIEQSFKEKLLKLFLKLPLILIFQVV